MTDGVVGLGLIVPLLYGEENPDSLKLRETLHHRIYLIQLFGLDMGFRFSWGVRGPYCSTLDDFWFEARQMPFIWKGRQLPEKDEDALRQARDFLDRVEGSGDGLISKEWLELVSSLHYLKHIATWLPDRSKEALEERMDARGFQPSQIRCGWAMLAREKLDTHKVKVA